MMISAKFPATEVSRQVLVVMSYMYFGIMILVMLLWSYIPMRDSIPELEIINIDV